MLKFLKKLLFQGNFCYHGADKKIRLQEQKLWGIFPKERGTKNHFSTSVIKAAA